MAYQSVNPYAGQVTNTFKDFTDEEVEVALQKAERCFEDWKRELLITVRRCCIRQQIPCEPVSTSSHGR